MWPDITDWLDRQFGKTCKKKGYANLIGKSHRELDLMDGASVRQFFDEEQPDYVFLAAAYVGGIVATTPIVPISFIETFKSKTMS
jgi:dTDP-4-dehydrorhamnose reductase